MIARKILAGKLIGPPLTASYRPSVSGLPAWYTGGLSGRAFDLNTVELMLDDSTVALGVSMIETPILRHEGQWVVVADTPEIQAFVERTYRRFWRKSLKHVLSCIRYGYAGGEVLYERNDDGNVSFKRVKPLHPFDIVPVSWVSTGEFAGVNVKQKRTLPGADVPYNNGSSSNGQMKAADLWAADADRPAKGLWISSGSTFNQYFGRSRLRSSWLPWRDKTGQDGATDIIRMWYYKNAYVGMVIRHPEKDIRLQDGNIIAARDMARQLGEWLKTGATVALPNTKNLKTGEYDWSIEWPHHNGDATGLLDYLRHLDDQILRGMHIPDDIITGSGGGFSGRKVPEDAFYTGEEEILHAVVEVFDREVVAPLVQYNFGNAKYEVKFNPILPVRQEPMAQMQAGAAAAGATPGAGGQPDIAKLLAQQGEPQGAEAQAKKLGMSLIRLSETPYPLKVSEKEGVHTVLHNEKPIAQYRGAQAAELAKQHIEEIQQGKRAPFAHPEGTKYLGKSVGVGLHYFHDELRNKVHRFDNSGNKVDDIPYAEYQQLEASQSNLNKPSLTQQHEQTSAKRYKTWQEQQRQQTASAVAAAAQEHPDQVRQELAREAATNPGYVPEHQLLTEVAAKIESGKQLNPSEKERLDDAVAAAANVLEEKENLRSVMDEAKKKVTEPVKAEAEAAKELAKAGKGTKPEPSRQDVEDVRRDTLEQYMKVVKEGKEDESRIEYFHALNAFGGNKKELHRAIRAFQEEEAKPEPGTARASGAPETKPTEKPVEEEAKPEPGTARASGAPESAEAAPVQKPTPPSAEEPKPELPEPGTAEAEAPKPEEPKAKAPKGKAGVAPEGAKPGVPPSGDFKHYVWKSPDGKYYIHDRETAGRTAGTEKYDSLEDAKAEADRLEKAYLSKRSLDNTLRRRFPKYDDYSDETKDVLRKAHANRNKVPGGDLEWAAAVASGHRDGIAIPLSGLSKDGKNTVKELSEHMRSKGMYIYQDGKKVVLARNSDIGNRVRALYSKIASGEKIDKNEHYNFYHTIGLKDSEIADLWNEAYKGEKPPEHPLGPDVPAGEEEEESVLPVTEDEELDDRLKKFYDDPVTITTDNGDIYNGKRSHWAAYIATHPNRHEWVDAEAKRTGVNPEFLHRIHELERKMLAGTLTTREKKELLLHHETLDRWNKAQDRVEDLKGRVAKTLDKKGKEKVRDSADKVDKKLKGKGFSGWDIAKIAAFVLLTPFLFRFIKKHPFGSLAIGAILALYLHNRGEGDKEEKKKLPSYVPTEEVPLAEYREAEPVEEYPEAELVTGPPTRLEPLQDVIPIGAPTKVAGKKKTEMPKTELTLESVIPIGAPTKVAGKKDTGMILGRKTKVRTQGVDTSVKKKGKLTELVPKGIKAPHTKMAPIKPLSELKTVLEDVSEAVNPDGEPLSPLADPDWEELGLLGEEKTKDKLPDWWKDIYGDWGEDLFGKTAEPEKPEDKPPEKDLGEK